MIARADVFGIGIRAKQAFGHGRVKPAFARDGDQGGDVANVAPLGPIGAEEGRDDGGLPPFQPRPMDQAVCVQRVGNAGNGAKIDLKACVARGLFDARVNLDCAGLAAKLCLQILASVPPIGGHVGVQLKGVPFDFKGVVRVRLKRAVKIALADIAPGANRVREDVELDHRGPLCRRARRLSFALAPRGRASRWR